MLNYRYNKSKQQNIFWMYIFWFSYYIFTFQFIKLQITVYGLTILHVGLNYMKFEKITSWTEIERTEGIKFFIIEEFFMRL